ncbi:MAG: hypothetical protein J0M04_10245 [Verrucomicrobia bacterium]|nr:hypothetical protein [Verrucomicrobiota bacterium]
MIDLFLYIGLPYIAIIGDGARTLVRIPGAPEDTVGSLIRLGAPMQTASF